MTTLLVAGTAYSNGNVIGLEHVGFPASTARRIAGRWLAVTSSSPAYAAVVDQVTLSSVLAYVTPTGTLAQRGPMRAFGQQVIEITGGIPRALVGGRATGRSILYVSAAAGHLPVAFDFVAKDGNERWLLGRWGERISMSAPITAIGSPA